jgi:succinate dehydrogenase/fumarate reductase cytochrome b subunit
MSLSLDLAWHHTTRCRGVPSARLQTVQRVSRCLLVRAGAAVLYCCGEWWSHHPTLAPLFELAARGPAVCTAAACLEAPLLHLYAVCAAAATTAAGFAAAGYVALTGDLPGTLAALRANSPLLCVPIKLAISFPLVYHYLGGLRHFVWDMHRIGNQADHSSLLETPKVEQSSQVLLGASVALSALLSLL